MLNEEILNKAHAAKSPEDLVKVGEGLGVKLDLKSAEEYYSAMHKSGEISDDEISNASAGCGGYSASVNKKCPYCGGNIPMGEVVEVTDIEPRSWGEVESTRYLPTGVCGRCGRRYAYVYKYDNCFLVLTEKGKYVIRPENPDFNVRT